MSRPRRVRPLLSPQQADAPATSPAHYVEQRNGNTRSAASDDVGHAHAPRNELNEHQKEALIDDIAELMADAIWAEFTGVN